MPNEKQIEKREDETEQLRENKIKQRSITERINNIKKREQNKRKKEAY